MSRKVSKPRNPWPDRFSTPTVEMLMGALIRQHSSLIGHLRTGILALDGASESVAWRGTWCWTLVYGDESEPERAWAYIVPRPSGPIVSVPIPEELMGSLPLKRMSKSVRDGIALAALVGGVRWPQWALTGRPLVEEVLLLVRKKRALSLSATV